MSEFKYVKVSLEELNEMTYWKVKNTEFYSNTRGWEPQGTKRFTLIQETERLTLRAKQENLYIRKEVEWHENITKHGIHVWYKNEVYLVKYIKDKGCFCNGDWIFDVYDCKPLTDEEVIKHFTGVKGE